MDGEPDPEEEVEFDETEENLIPSVHRLDTSVGTEKLVDFPTKLSVDLPPESTVDEFCYGNDDRDNGGEDADRDM